MWLIRELYKVIFKRTPPYYFNYSIFTILMKPLRKWLTNTVAANCPFNCIRIAIYRLCGFKIGKHTFIGMKCYLDDMCYDLLTIGDHVIISYGVFFACHGKNQEHLPIRIEDHAYVGMRSNIISRNRDVSKRSQGITIGEHAVIGACTLVNCDIPGGMTAVGSPCRILEERNHE